MNAHTPGPWAAVYDGSGTWSIGPEGDPQGECIAGVRGPGVFSKGDRFEHAAANARLIAAAPELLEAMKVILGGFEKGIFVRDISRDDDPLWALGCAIQIAALAKAQAAIAKAEGR